MKYALVVALLIPLAAEQPGISFSPGFIIEAADSPANPQCPCYPCRCGSTCHCTGEAPCDCRDGSTCFCPCVGCPCDKGKPCICGKDCKCKKCPGKPTGSSYESKRSAAIADGVSLYVWIGMSCDSTKVEHLGLSYHVTKPNGWQGIQGPAYVVSEYYEENGVGKLWWKKVVDLRPPQRYTAPSRC